MDKASSKRLAILVMIATPLFFSTNLVFGRLVIAQVAPFTLALIRWGAVAVVLSPFVWRERAAAVRILRSHGWLVALLGLLGMWICGAGVYVGLQTTTATNGILIYTAASVMTILLEAVFRGRPISWREAAGSAIAFAGIVVIVSRGEWAVLASIEFNTGDLLFVAAAFAWAVYSILYRTPALAGLSNLALLALIAAAGTVLLAPVSAWEIASGQPLPSTAPAWAGIAGIIVFASLLAFTGFQYGARTLGPSLAAIFMYLLPPFGVAMAVAFVGETFHAYHAVGIALVMGGVILATWPSRAQPSVPSDGKVSSSQ